MNEYDGKETPVKAKRERERDQGKQLVLFGTWGRDKVGKKRNVKKREYLWSYDRGEA